MSSFFVLDIRAVPSSKMGRKHISSTAVERSRRGSLDLIGDGLGQTKRRTQIDLEGEFGSPMERTGAASISVIIPTFRRPEMLQALLVSLRAGSRVPDEVLVVDNDPDGSASPVPIEGLHVHVIRAGLGMSLAGARNAGWRASSSDVCLFIDDDNEVEYGAVEALLDACRSSLVGLAGPVIYAGDTGRIWCAGITRSLWTGRTCCILGGETSAPPESSWETDDMPDAFAVPRIILEKLNGFDETRFPIHYDESDFTARIRELGLHNVVVSDAVMRHYGWVGINPGRAMVRAASTHGADRVRQMAISRMRFHTLHSSGIQRLCAIGVFLPIWVALTALGCLGAEAPWRLRLSTAWAVGSGVVAGYREFLMNPPEQKAGGGSRGGGQRLQHDSEQDWAASDTSLGKLVPPTRMLLANIVKNLAFYSGLHRILFYRYDYMFRPRELALLVSYLSETHGLPGPIFEIGCAAGHTTVYLNKHLDDLRDSRSYFCLDTFAGFTKEDIEVEVGRGHDSGRYAFLFRAYRQDWFDQTMENNNIARVTSMQADVNQFDFSPYENISFCLIDVDLMRPVTSALEAVFPRMAAGGIILVDDCAPNRKYDGAYEAYVEFVRKVDSPVDIRYGKLGVIKIPGLPSEESAAGKPGGSSEG
jgi:O-methyltransferase